MPVKFVVRDLQANSFYHIYNRGNQKDLFADDQDRRVWLWYLFIYLAPLSEVEAKYPDLPPRLLSKNLHGEASLAAYCLMSDHFHMLVHQEVPDAIPRLLKRMVNGYTSYFHQKYKSSGPVMHGRYKAARIDSNDLASQLVKYIHDHTQDEEWTSFKKYQSGELKLDQFGLTEVNGVRWEAIKHLIIEGI